MYKRNQRRDVLLNRRQGGALIGLLRQPSGDPRQNMIALAALRVVMAHVLSPRATHSPYGSARLRKSAR